MATRDEAYGKRCASACFPVLAFLRRLEGCAQIRLQGRQEPGPMGGRPRVVWMAVDVKRRSP